MTELTINTLIKIVLATAVLVVVIIGIYFGMKSYVIPYFSGIGFETPKIDTNSQFGKELIQTKNKIGEIKNVDGTDYFYGIDGKQTEIYFKKERIYFEKHLGELNNDKGFFSGILNSIKDRLSPDDEIGLIDKDAKIIIEKEVKDKSGINLTEKLNNAYRNGNEIYKIK